MEIADAIESQLDAQAQLESIRREREEFLRVRHANLPSQVAVSRRQHEQNKSSLKSDLKKATAFVKKIRSINAEGLQQCIRDTDSLNLVQYLSEIVNAILEINFKATDVTGIVTLCVCLHKKYEDFTSSLIPALQSALLSPPATPGEDDKDAGKKRRIQVRLSVELFLVGVWTDDNFFCELLKIILGKSAKGGAKPSVDLLSLSTFVKYGCECLLGYIPRKVLALCRAAGIDSSKDTSAIPVNLLASQASSEVMRGLVADIFAQLCGKLVQAHKELHTKEKKMEKDKMIHGTITEQKQLELDNSRKLFERIHSTVLNLAESIGEEMPVLEVEKEEVDGSSGISVWEGLGSGANSAPVGDFGPFGDAETKAFYEELPDLLTIVPLSALGLSNEQAAALREEWKASKERSQQASIEDEQDATGAVAAAAAAAAVTDDDVESSIQLESEAAVEVADPSAAASTPAAADETPQAKLNSLLQDRLPECVNRQKCDDFCASFCLYNSKGARKKLVANLIKLHRSRSELTCTYSRIIASLSRLFPDIGPPVLEALNREFYGQLRLNKSQQYLETRMKTLRYLAELVKFGVAPPITAFRMCRALLADFTNHNIELICLLLETCGRYLYLLPFTHDRVEEILETLLRLRRIKFLDLRQQTAIETAYFVVKPPERSSKAKKELTRVQQYARYLILERLDARDVTVDAIILSLRRLPWADAEEQLEEHVTKAILKVARKKYVSIPSLADCLSGLNRYVSNLVIRVIDRVLEELQRGLDSPHRREPQRLLGMARLVGELYNYSVVSSALVFELLYHLINFGHNCPAQIVSSSAQNSAAAALPLSLQFDPRVVSELDSPSDLFRAQLVCEVLNACGSYYVKGQAKEKLSRFLIYFQRYLFSKSSIPLHVEFSILDTFENLEELARAAHAEKPVGKGKVTRPVVATEAAGPYFQRLDTYESVLSALAVVEARPVIETEAEAEAEAEADQDDDDDDDEGERKKSNKAENINGEEYPENENENAEEDDDHDGEGGDDEEEEDEDDDEELANANAAQLLESMRASEEDEEFEKAFKTLMLESVESVKSVSSKQSADRMAIPVKLPKPKNVASEYRPGGDDEVDEDGNSSSRGTVAFKLLSRDSKGRVETRQLLVPEDASMAVKQIKTEAAMKLEKQKIKEKVLQIESLAEKAALEGVAIGGGLQSSGQDFFGMRDIYEGSPKPQPSIAPAGNGFGPGGRSGTFRLATRGPVSGRGSGSSGRQNNSSLRAEESRRPADTLNLDEFLAETNAAEMRQIRMKDKSRV